MWCEKLPDKFSLKMPDFHFHMTVNLRHGTHSFTSLPKGRRAEDFFFALKNPKASAGFEPANLWF
jgi:hypothetical protein